MDSIPTGYDTAHYTLSTKALYKIDKKVELFNILYPEGVWQNTNRRDSLFADKNLILFSALPNIVGNNDWTQIDPDNIHNQTVQLRDIIKLFRAVTLTGYKTPHPSKTKFFNEYQIVVKREGKYYTPVNCLLQFYAIRNRNEIFNDVFGTINMKQQPRTIIEVEKIFKSQFVKSEFPLYMLRPEASISFFDENRDRREFLSEVIESKNKNKLYKFWTFTGWDEHPCFFETERGIDRFIYLPSKGIIGGSFDFYFFHFRKVLDLTIKDFIDNIRTEKVMLADSLPTIS